MKPGPLRRRKGLTSRPRRRTPAEKEASTIWRELVVASRPAVFTALELEERARGERRFAIVLAHHIILQQVLRRRARDLGVPPKLLVCDVRVGMPASKRRHERHHSGHEPILREELPAAVFEFAAEWGLTEWLDRHYPVDR